MVPPPAPSFCVGHGSLVVGLPAGKAGLRPRQPAHGSSSGVATYPRSVLKAVLLDVDFTLFRPGPELGPQGYERVGSRRGLALDPDRYEEARLGAIEDLQRHPELVHDEELWIRFTEDIVRGMGGDAEGSRACAIDLVREWERHENFFLYEDALPALEVLRSHELRIGLVSNGQRDLEAFARHHRLDVDVCMGSLAHGRVKPHRSIFEAALAALDARPSESAMVGDSLADDIEGARALGMRAILLDRDGLHEGEPDRIDTLLALPAALGLSARSGSAEADPGRGDPPAAPGAHP